MLIFPTRRRVFKEPTGYSKGRLKRVENSGWKGNYLGAEILGENTDIYLYVLYNRAEK